MHYFLIGFALTNLIIGSYAGKQQKGYWDSLENRLQYLISFGEKTGFDPTVPANWKGMTHKIQANEVHPKKGGKKENLQICDNRREPVY